MEDKNLKLPISVVILTLNEEKTIKGAIKSAKEFFDEVIILDSFSSDNTISFSRNFGAKVVCNKFKGYASQRNFALKELDKKNKWVFFIDADERISSDLIKELKIEFQLLKETTGMFCVRRKDIFNGKWIKHSSGYPTWFGRVCHSDYVEVKREINEEFYCSKKIIYLKEHLIHYPFAKGIKYWIERHNSYSTMEAKRKFYGEKFLVKELISNNPIIRRKALKQIYMRLPFRPFFGFLYLYFFRFGFLDGLPGLRFAILRSFYEMMISIKVDELKDKNFNLEYIEKN